LQLKIIIVAVPGSYNYLVILKDGTLQQFGCASSKVKIGSTNIFQFQFTCSSRNFVVTRDSIALVNSITLSGEI